MSKIAVYAGTFDPITCGHVDVIHRAAKLFDEVIVAVAVSARKTPLFDLQKRLSWCEKSVENCQNVRILPLEGIAVSFAIAHNAGYFIRGIRTINNVDYEIAIANMNDALSKNKIDTIFLASKDVYRSISATMVREIISLQGDVSAFVPACVVNDLKSL